VSPSTSENLAIVQVGLNLDSQIERFLPKVSERLTNINPVLLPPLTNVDEALDSKRNQYHSTRIIAILESDVNLSTYHKIVGVTALDLYNPGMDGQGFVFGEARCPGRSSIVSTARLRETSHDKPETVENRVRKEVVHEIGHMKGLKHCSSSLCVMNRSLNVTNIDMKTDEYCGKCQRRLGLQP
jgi:archaemetzincin